VVIPLGISAPLDRYADNNDMGWELCLGSLFMDSMKKDEFRSKHGEGRDRRMK